MDIVENNMESYVECLLEPSPDDQLFPVTTEPKTDRIQCAVWTTRGTSTLLKLYDKKLEMLETPKKKTKIWIAIAESLRDHDIDVNPDQVRWKINALTKEYKRCIKIGNHEKFRYFKEMNQIYEKYEVDCDSYSISEFLSRKKLTSDNSSTPTKYVPEPKAMIKMRKARLAKRIHSDRFQGKIKLEKQLLEYLHKQEEQNQWRDKILDRELKIREERLEMLKKELELKESLEHKKIQLMDKQHKELLQIEKEKCELLKQMLSQLS